MAFYQLRFEQKIPAPLEQVWGFISSPANLKKITPEHMGFDIITEGMPEKMYEGMIISYRVKPLPGIPVKWVTEITHVETNRYFVDEQRIGPYSLWHHEHFLIPVDGGVLMKDIISYKPPFGFLGAIANTFFIQKKLKDIFLHRKHALEKIFGVYS